MRFFLIYLLSLSLLLVFMPAVIAGGWWAWEKETAAFPALEEGAEHAGTGPDLKASRSFQIYLKPAGKDTLQEIELEDYVRGVVAAEMPASFHPEALKAQAVAARTYAWQKAGPGGKGCPHYTGVIGGAGGTGHDGSNGSNGSAGFSNVDKTAKSSDKSRNPGSSSNEHDDGNSSVINSVNSSNSNNNSSSNSSSNSVAHVGNNTVVGGVLCTESTCCQAWLDDQSAREKWPAEEADFYLERIAEAVRATQGQVLTYDGQLITAVYHSTCGGKTEAAAEVWNGSGHAYPYLQSVDCSYCRNSPAYSQEIAMELSTYAAALQGEKEALPVLAEGNFPLLEVVQKSASGRNLLLRLGQPGRLYSGSELRRLLGLPSTRFHWRVEGGKIIFSVQGNGHGVGMCQYGANGLAGTGMDYTAILNYYYQGAVVKNLADLAILSEGEIQH